VALLFEHICPKGGALWLNSVAVGVLFVLVVQLPRYVNTPPKRPSIPGRHGVRTYEVPV
jgi:hypothetical protein